MKSKKVKKQYSVDPEIAIAVDVKAARDQVFASSIVEKALYSYLKLEPKETIEPADYSTTNLD